MKYSATIITIVMTPLLAACGPSTDGSAHESYTDPTQATATATEAAAPTTDYPPIDDSVSDPTYDWNAPPPIVWITPAPTLAEVSVNPINLPPPGQWLPGAPSEPNDIYVDPALSAQEGHPACRRHSNGEFATCP